jgi:hypothetical protein
MPKYYLERGYFLFFSSPSLLIIHHHSYIPSDTIGSLIPEVKIPSLTNPRTRLALNETQRFSATSCKRWEISFKILSQSQFSPGKDRGKPLKTSVGIIGTLVETRSRYLKAVYAGRVSAHSIRSSDSWKFLSNSRKPAHIHIQIHVFCGGNVKI